MKNRNVKKVNWDAFNDDEKLLEYLKSLPRYKNNSLKSAFWRITFFLKVIHCHLFKKMDKPLFVVFVTNNKCNLNCRYCYGYYGERKKHKDYSTKESVKIIDELKDLGTGLLTLHGGESLLRKDIGEIFNYAKLKGFYVSLNTNGYLVPERIKEIKCLDNICLSLDGREENNDKNRGKGCYQKVMKAIEVIAENDLPCVLSATLTKDTVDDMEVLAELAETKKCRLQYSILYNAGELARRHPDIVMSDSEIREVARQILELKNRGFPVYYSKNVLAAAIDWPIKYDEKMFLTKNDKEFIKNRQFVECYHGSLKYQIDGDGRVITCWAQDHPHAPNIKTLGVKGAIRQCHENNQCRYCAFLANNEHNALLGLGVKNIINLIGIHIADVIKIKRRLVKKNIHPS